jgi:hypothetical protein
MPKPTVTPSKGDMAPRACTRAMGVPSNRNTAVSVPINGVPIDLDPGNVADPICIAFTSAILVDPDPGDACTAHAAHINSVCIDPDLIIFTSSIRQLLLLLLVLSTFFSHYFHSLDSNFHIRIFSFGLLKDILGIGDADVTIWRGVDGVVDLGL